MRSTALAMVCALAVTAAAGEQSGDAGQAPPPADPATSGDSDEAPALTPEEQSAFAGTRWEANADRLPGRGESETAAVPEPGTIALLGTGLAALAVMRRRARAR
jgi:hypothetical protein